MQYGASLSVLDRHTCLQTVEGLLVQALAILGEESSSLAESLAAAHVDHALNHLRGTHTHEVASQLDTMMGATSDPNI